jgi:sugar lactone lactonase YvrE
MNDMSPAIDCLVADRMQIGESPVWDGAHRRLYWCDIPGRAVHAIDVESGARRAWRFESEVGSFGLAESGRLVIALRHSVILFDTATEAREALAEIEPEIPHTRTNDGKVGPDGAFWIGTMNERPEREPIASLYRVTADGTVERKIDALKVSNGIAWSGDGRTMFHSDSRGPWIDRWRFDPETGAIAERTRFASPDEATGRPDGGATDVDGCYWSAGVSAGCLNRFAPDGKLAMRIDLPLPAPTMPCFGGDDMRTLFVTSLSAGLGNEILAARPLAGAILQLGVEVPGVPVGRFRDR